MGITVDQRLDMSVGCEVEVCYKDEGVVCYDEPEHGIRVRYHDNHFRGVWYKAIIEKTTPKPRSTLLSVRLLKDDFATPLAQLSEKAFFRPVPPHNLQTRLYISEGQVVDAYHKDGWWTGFLIKEIEDGKCFVFFDSPPDIIQFEKKHLRRHLDWVDKRSWIVPKFKLQLWRRLTEESIFSSGTMVEVSSNIDNMEIVWVPALVIQEIEEKDDEKKYIVKFCNESLSCKGTKENLVTIDLRNIRPIPPPVLVEEYKLLDCVEAFHGSKWRKGIVKRIISQKQYMVSFEDTKKQLKFNHSDLRPPMEWEDGVWKTKESPLAQGSGNRMAGSVMNGNTPSLANESASPVTPLKQEEAETQGKTPQPVRNQNGLANDSTRENESSEDNNRKRKREENLTSAANVVEETTKAHDTTMVLPFVKTFPIWKTLESMEVFKKFPQSPHFSPLVDISEDSRETFAVGLMFTFTTLLEEIKILRLSGSITKLIKISNSFCKLEKHGFDVKAHHSRIHKVFALRAKLAEKKDERESTEKKIAEKERKKGEIRGMILELQRLREVTDEEIKKMKSCTATIDQEIEDVELQFKTTVSAPW